MPLGLLSRVCCSCPHTPLPALCCFQGMRRLLGPHRQSGKGRETWLEAQHLKPWPPAVGFTEGPVPTWRSGGVSASPSPRSPRPGSSQRQSEFPRHRKRDAAWDTGRRLCIGAEPEAASGSGAEGTAPGQSRPARVHPGRLRPVLLPLL